VVVAAVAAVDAAWTSVAAVCSVSAACPANAAGPAVGAGTGCAADGCGAVAAACTHPRAWRWTRSSVADSRTASVAAA